MIIDRSQIFLSDGGELDDMFDLLASSTCNLETITFATPSILTGDFEKHIKQYKKKIAPLKIKRIHLHGPFFDIVPTSPDPDVADLARKRYYQGLDAAVALGAEKIIFHSQYNPLLRLSKYVENWKSLSIEFFSQLLKEKKYKNIMILVENMFEESPDLLRQLMDALDSPRMGICMDVGHVNVYGAGKFSHWIGKLAPFIRYLHLSDNNGKIDRHWPLGKGSLDFQQVFKLLAKEGIKPDLCLELNGETDLKKSLDFIDSLPGVELVGT